MFSRKTSSENFRQSVFIERMASELPRLVGLGMLEQSQADRIAAFYEREAAENPELSGNSEQSAQAENRAALQDRLLAIVICVAVLLIGLGVILFYSAIWKSMSPTVKLVQIFAWLSAVFAGAYGCLFHWRLPLTGRGLSLLGMLGFGAAIGLISQIYHISSEPATGVLVWMLGVFALSFVLREKAGYFLAAALLYLWNSWVTNWDDPEQLNANYALIPLTVLLGALFYTHERRSPTGLCIAIGFGLMAAYQVSVAWLLPFMQRAGEFYRVDEAGVAAAEQALLAAAVVFTVNVVLIGVILRGLGLIGMRLANRSQTTPEASETPADSQALALRVPAGLLRLLGWLHVLLPLSLITWPLDFSLLGGPDTAGAGSPALYPGVLPAIFASPAALPDIGWLLALTALWLAIGVALLIYARGKLTFPLQPAATVIVGALLLLVWPLGIDAAQLSAGYVLLFLVLGIWLVAVLRRGSQELGRLERGLFVGFVLLTLFSKAFGLLFMGIESDQFLVAYGAGFLLFANVIYLIVRYAGALNPATAGSHVIWLCDAGVAFTVYWMLYALGFVPDQQSSIWGARPIVLTLIALLIATALVLYALLIRRGGLTLPLGLSALVSGTAILALVAGGPWLPPAAYVVFFSLLLLIFVGAMLVYSIRIASVALANTAIAGLVLLILTRYFDLAWDLLSGSALFIVTGLLLLVGGYFLERQRRRLVDTIESQEAGQ